MYMLMSLTINHLFHIVAVAVSSINNGAPADDFQPLRKLLLIGRLTMAELMYLLDPTGQCLICRAVYTNL